MTAYSARKALPLERLDTATRSVLGALLGGHRYGLDIARSCRLKPSAVYPALARLEEYGWLAAEWQDPGEQARSLAPRRRLYRLTTDGADQARRVVGGPAPSPRPIDLLTSRRNRRSVS